MAQLNNVMGGPTQISAERMENLILSLGTNDNETFSSFHCRVQHLELDLTNSGTGNPWESFFACVLQKLLGCIDCDDLENIVQQAGKSWAILQVKINEIIRSSSAILNKSITCEEISKTIQNRSKGIQNHIEDLLQFLNQSFNKDVKLSFFDWRNLTLSHFQYTHPDKSGKEEHVILITDPDRDCFRLLIPLFRPDSSVDDYFEELFDQMVHTEEMQPYFIKQFEKLATADFQPWVESQFEMLEQVTSIPEFPKVLLQNYDELVPSSKFSLLAKYFDSIQPATKEEILQSLKYYYILTVEKASKIVLETRIAEYKDKVLKRVEKEDELLRQNNQLERDYKNSEKQKRLLKLELERYRQNLEADTATKRRQEELIRQREQDIAKTDEALKQKRCQLSWNNFRKQLMQVEFSFKTLKQAAQVHSTSSKSLLELCNHILTEFSLPFFANPVERENLLSYAASNNEPKPKAEITDILTFLFQPPRIAFNANNNEILQVTGRHLIVSDVLKSITRYNFKELRLAAGLTIFLDANLPQDRFHGISIVMSSPTIEVVGMVTINTSGNPGNPQSKPPKAPDGEYNGRNGTDGEDGTAGESSGHVYLQTSKWELSRNLTIIANGGDGGFGQDGGDGKDGDAGRDGADGDADANWKNQPDWNKYIDRGTKGNRGDKGGDGGRAGLGGGGGERGIVFTSENFCGNATSIDGCQGEDGKAGVGGNGGPGGYDGTDHGRAWHNYAFLFGEFRKARGELDVRKQNVWYGGNGWDLITKRTESEVRSCQACRGGEGIVGKDTTRRSNQRKTTSAINKVSSHEIFDLSKSVRSVYNHKDLAQLTRETAALMADEALESQRSMLRNQKSDAVSANDQIDARLVNCQKKIHETEESRAQLEINMVGTKNQQQDVLQNLETVASEKHHLNSVINTTKHYANQLSMTFQKQFKLRNQAQQQIQATITKEFDANPPDLESTQPVISEDNQVNKETWIAQYKDIHNTAALPDEALPTVLASRFSNEESGRAFKTSLQSVISNQTLSTATKGFIHTVFNYFRSDTTSSSVRYSENGLSADVGIVEQTEAWSTEDHKEASVIFSLDNKFKGTSVGDFLLHIRNSKEFEQPGKIQAFQTKIEKLISKGKLPDNVKILLSHLSIVMVDFMEVWMLEEIQKYFLKSGIRESREISTTVLDQIRRIYFEVKEYLPELTLQETYNNFLGVVTSTNHEAKHDKNIWHEFVLVTTKLKSYSYLTAIRTEKSDFDLIEASFGSLMKSLMQINSNPAIVSNKLQILSLVFRYVNLLPEQLQKLFSTCEEISSIILQTDQNIFLEIQNVRKSIVENFQKNHQKPFHSNIRDYINEVFEGKANKQLLSECDAVSELFGSSQCYGVSFSFWLKCMQDFHKFVEKLVDFDDVSEELDELKSKIIFDLLKEIDDFAKDPPPENAPGSSTSFTQSMFNAGQNAKNFLTRDRLSKGHSKLIKQEHIPEIVRIIKMLRQQTSRGYVRQAIEDSDLASLSVQLQSLNVKLKTFFDSSPDFTKICLIRQELERLQLYFKAQSISKIQNNVTDVFGKRKTWMTTFDNKIAEIVKWVETRIENSNLILHQQEILMCLKMHLIKIVNGRQVSTYGNVSKPMEISKVLETIEAHLQKSCSECTPEKLIDEVETWLNKQTSVLTDLLCYTLEGFKPDRNAKLTDLIDYISHQLEEFKKSPSLLPQLIETLKISCQVLLHCSDIELNVFSDNSNKVTVSKFPQLHASIKNVSQNYLQDNSKLAQLLKQLDFLVTSHENSDFARLFQAILSSRQTMFQDLEQKVEFLLQRIQYDLEDIFEVHRQCGENTLKWTTSVNKYCDNITTYISSDFEIATLGSCEKNLFQTYVQSLIAFPCFQDARTPSSVKASITELEITGNCEQFRAIFISIGLSSNIAVWGFPVLLVVQRLTGILSEDNCTCWDIHSLVAEIERFAKNVQGTKECTVLEMIVLKLTALSYQILGKIATERELLDKAHSSISMVSHRRGIIQQSLLRCQIYQKFESYFYLHASEDLVIFYNETVLPIIDMEVVDIFGLRMPTSTIQEHLIRLVNSAAKHFYHRNSEIMGLVILNYNLNQMETDFCKAMVNFSKSWTPTLENKNRLIGFIESNNPQETKLNPRENRLIKIFLKEINVEKKNLNLPFVSDTELIYLKFLIRSVNPSQLLEVSEKIIEILTYCCMNDWESAFKELVKNALFLRFLDFYVPEDYTKNLENVGQKVMEKLCKEFGTYRSSYKEVPQNAETMELTSKQFDRQSNTNTRLELKVHDMIRFKHFFNRHFHFKRGEDENEIFQTFDLLLQRFLVFHVPFEEFNDLFYRLIELSSKHLIRIISKSSPFDFMEGILIEIVNKNYAALCKKKGDLDSSDSFDIEKCLVEWKENGSAKRKLIGILADAILQEVECSSGSTTIDLNKVHKAVQNIQNLKISTGLVNDLHKSPLTFWVRKTRLHQLLQNFGSKTADAILKFEDKFGHVKKALLEKCYGQSENLIFKFFNNINSCRWDASVFQFLETEKDFTRLNSICETASEKMQNAKWDLKDISRLMRDNPKNCSIQSYLEPVSYEVQEENGVSFVVDCCPLESHIKTVLDKLNSGSDVLKKIKRILADQSLAKKIFNFRNILTVRNYVTQTLPAIINGEDIAGFDSPIHSWDQSMLKQWAGLIKALGDKNDRAKIVKEHLEEVLAVICRGVYLNQEYYPYYPRDTQLVSVWLLIQRSFQQKGCLAEIQTGEGKTLIVAMAVIVRVLCGDDVDVITSSPVLAEENLSNVQALYELFGVTSATNCDLEAERDEKVRKKRYSNRVIYGDVASFQRDILLTNFFDRAITMGRTTDIIFVDEVDSMLLDKGENILYLSHNIQDLRSLWPVFVEIWNTVHAPNVSRGRPEDVVLVARFVKDRIKKGDIFFPNSLQNFINEKLVVWIQNAFLAMNMKENDPYILSDVNKKGTTIVIMDKDTGVEQVNMNWSNGLHQFIQLKHTDRLTSESLKAVFMSNICYFRKFKGKLFGITGTLGSTTERELLSKCYAVDFFAVPRFQARRCIEDEGYVLPDESTWIKKIQEIVHEKCSKDRAVLIICENVDSVDKIVQELRPLHSDKVSAYKSSFDEEFRKKKESSPLDCGHILAATNIAGRGTDWRTTKSVEKAGGLHVILSYMPGNVRIEEQAFGRTARKGLPGSVQYVVIHDRTDETTVNTLRRERDENESNRLDNFRIKSIPRIEIEEKLCEQFHQTLKIVKENLKEKDKDAEKLHIENLKNKWAMWLDSMTERLKLSHVEEEPILTAFQKFKEDMISKAGSTSKFESGPVELIKLGKLYEEKNKFVRAISYYDKAIETEPNYCEVAHYYKAATILKEESSKMDAKRQAIHHLKSSHQLLKKRINQLMTSAKTLQMTDNIRRQDGKGTMSNRYEKQVENECELYQVHCGKIEEAIGAPITQLTFKSVRFVMNEEESNKIFQVLRKNRGICKNYRLSKKVSFNEAKDIVIDNTTTIEWPHFFMYCKSPVVELLKKALEDGTRSSRYMEDDSFCGVFQNSIATRNKFWNFLIQNNVLINNRLEKLIIVRSSDPEKFKTIILPEELKDYHSILETILRKFDTEVYDMSLLDDLQLPPDKLSVIEVELTLAGILSLEYIPIAEVNSEFTEKLTWNPSQRSWDGFDLELQQYQDLIEATIEKYSGDGSKQPIFEDQIRFDEITLPADELAASKQVWSFLRDIRAIKDVRVDFSLKDVQNSQSKIKARLAQIQGYLAKEKELVTIFHKYHEMDEIRPTNDDVMVVLAKAIGNIKTLASIDVSYSPICDYYKTGAYPPELEDFNDQSFGNMLELTEKKHWWDWGAFAVAMLGLLQIAAGICLVVTTGGINIHLGAFLISEGIGDVLFAIQAGLINRNFSWTDYGIHKVFSVAISVVTLGIGSWLGQGVEAARYIGKTTFELLKLTGRNVLKQAGKAIAEYFLEYGFDKFLDYIRETILGNCKTQLNSMVNSGNAALYDEMGEVMDQIHAHSYEKGQAERLINNTFESAFQNEKTGGVGNGVGKTANEICGSVINLLGNCSRIANHEVFANSSNKHVQRMKKFGKIIDYIMKASAIVKPLVDMATHAKDILTALIRSLKTTLENLKMNRIDNEGQPEDKSKKSEFESYKKNFFQDITANIINFIASTIQQHLLMPAFNYSARSVVKFLNKKLKKSANNSVRHLNTEKCTTIIKQLHFDKTHALKNQASSKIKGRVTVRELDPHTLLQGSDFTVTTAANMFGDDAVFYEDNKGKVYFGKPTLTSVIQNFGRGKSASIVELFACACYFGFIITVEDTTGELNCDDDKMQITPVSHGASMKTAKSGYINVNLVYLRNDQEEAQFKPKYKREVQELEDEPELTLSKLGLYQSLIFLKKVMRVERNVCKNERRTMMKDACELSNVASTIAEVKCFVQSNLKDVNIVEHLYEKMSQQNSTRNSPGLTMESVQILSLDGIDTFEGGYGNGHILLKIQNMSLKPDLPRK